MQSHRAWLAGITVCVVAAAAYSADSNDWPRFRGPDGAGVGDANIPARWESGDVRWKIELSGVGHASIAASGDKLFTTCGDEQTGTQSLVCLAAKDGSVVWKRNYTSEAYRHHGENSYAS